MEKMRKEFEAWIDSETGFDCFRTNYPMTKPEDQQYMCHRTNLAWLSWKASRSALCVKLPETIDDECGSFAEMSCLTRSLDDAGVRYE